MRKMKIILDQKIHLPNALLCSKGELIRLPTETISREKLKNADCLLVRSVTKIDQDLLGGTSIRFVGSATAGTDHLDIDYLNRANITWAHAPGANAQTVVNYVDACIAGLRGENLLTGTALRAGVIGVGQVGRRVVSALENLGFDVLQNDPPRAIKEPSFVSTPLTEFKNLDLICVHTPLTFDNEFSTHHLIDAAFLSRQKAGCILLNAGRGAVVDSHALKKATHIIKVLDVWENEPNIDLELLKLSKIATPHIAGYSQAAKNQAATMLYHALCNFYNFPAENVTPKHNEFFIDDIMAVSNRFKHSTDFKTCRHEFEKQILSNSHYD